ncbi:MAG: hypothetical protein HOH98_02785 [Flavobacteriaceae bacterium]|jgi:hypothetical protein|nr:hypothetical protein [Flavobacteriaceae bacterium]
MNKSNLIVHRVNSIEILNSIDTALGCEIDIRTDGSKLILNHNPFKKGDNLVDYLDEYHHGTLVLNIKETGIESIVLEEVQKRNIKSYFLLDVEMPYLIKAFIKNEKKLAVRFSEYEPIENVVVFKNKFNWIWVDSITKVPITDENFQTINKFNVCVVCPSLWKRSEDINKEKYKLSKYNFDNLKIITKHKYIDMWLDSFN